MGIRVERKRSFTAFQADLRDFWEKHWFAGIKTERERQLTAFCSILSVCITPSDQGTLPYIELHLFCLIFKSIFSGFLPSGAMENSWLGTSYSLEAKEFPINILFFFFFRLKNSDFHSLSYGLVSYSLIFIALLWM